MTTEVAVTIPEGDLTAAYRWALEHALIQARGGDDDLEQGLTDAATDGVLWAVRKFDPAAGEFLGWCRSCVRQAVGRAKVRITRRRRAKPVSLHDLVSLDDPDRPFDPPARPSVLPADRPVDPAFADLPDELRAVARLTTIDGYTQEDTGLLLGITKQAVHLRLKVAAKLVAGSGPAA